MQVKEIDFFVQQLFFDPVLQHQVKEHTKYVCGELLIQFFQGVIGLSILSLLGIVCHVA